jgi:integrase/recombinase XerD
MNERKFNELLWEFHQNLKGLNHLSDDTVKIYLSCIIQYEYFCQEKLQINLLKTKEEHLFEFIIDLKKKTGPSRISHFRAALRRFFKMILLYGLIEGNPAQNILPVKRTKSTRYKHIPAEAILSLIKAAGQTDEKETKIRGQRLVRDMLMILLLWCLGLRSFELRSIKKEDIKIIDFEKKTALLNVHGKGAKQRALLIMDKLFDQITDYSKNLNEHDLLFPGKNNNIMDDSTINKRIKKYANSAGIKTHITAHCLRHSFATEMYYANVPLEAIKNMLGHENLRETSAYIHVSDVDVRQSLNLLHIGV